MTKPEPNPIAALLMQNVTRELVLGVEEALMAGSQRAFGAARGMDEGHLPHVVGQLRHFHMNEALYRTFAASDAAPSPIRGNGLVTGRAGVFTLARFNIKLGLWVNGRRSQTRRQMALANSAIEPLVQPGLFDRALPPSEGVAFFVSCFSGDLNVLPDVPVSIYIAVPDHTMTGWLFREPLSLFVQRYQEEPAAQDDLANPTLKRGAQRKNQGDA